MCDRACISDGLRPATLVFRARNTVLRPDFHGHTDDVVALFAQQIAGHAGVDSTAHAKQHAFSVQVHRSEELRSIGRAVNVRWIGFSEDDQRVRRTRSTVFTRRLTNLLSRKVDRQAWGAERGVSL